MLFDNWIYVIINPKDFFYFVKYHASKKDRIITVIQNLDCKIVLSVKLHVDIIIYWSFVF